MRDMPTWIKSVEQRLREHDRRIRASGGRFPDTEWIGMPLNGSWINYGSGFTLARYRRFNGFTVAQGLVANGSGTMFTFPPTFRPTGGTLIFDAHAGVESRVDVDPAGNLSLVGSSAPGYLSLNNVIFPAEV